MPDSSSINIGFNPQERLFLHRLDQKFKKNSPIILIVLLLGIVGGLSIGYNLTINKTSSTNNVTVSKTQSVTTFAPNLLPDKTISEIQPGELSCPTSAIFCQNISNIKGASMSANIAANTPIYAAFDGQVEGFKSHHQDLNNISEDFTYVILNNPDRGLQALYYFQGNVPVSSDVKKGSMIALSSGKPVVFMGEKSFIFELLKSTASGEIPENIKAEYFGSNK